MVFFKDKTLDGNGLKSRRHAAPLAKQAAATIMAAGSAWATPGPFSPFTEAFQCNGQGLS